jgi:cytidine deaminase
MEKNLQEMAVAARLRAYAPYSRFLVGAALLSESGRVFAAGNIENVSLGLTMCAERVCVGMAVAEGERCFQTIAIVADSKDPIAPCGACRQVLAEFSPNLNIITYTLNGSKAEFMLDDLLPHSIQGILD